MLPWYQAYFVWFLFNKQDDQEGVRTIDDDAFIDDTGVDPADRYGSDNEGSAGDAPQVGESSLIKIIFLLVLWKKTNRNSYGLCYPHMGSVAHAITNRKCGFLILALV